jgi:hypothetical protein
MLAEKIAYALTLHGTLPARELRRQCGFDAIPWQSRRQHHERVAWIDHAVETGAEKVWRAHNANPSRIVSPNNASWGIWWTAFTRNLQDSCGSQANCRADSVPVELKAMLDQYADLHAKTWTEPVDAPALIPHMLTAFMERDRGFKALRNGSKAARAGSQCSATALRSNHPTEGDAI